ncbi:MAG TPA: extracellular solute-binding protein [Rhodanobacteraceae bacterium]|nr:extracellular solute-binding protein [Rhodanobacteraceae bacterium]
MTSYNRRRFLQSATALGVAGPLLRSGPAHSAVTKWTPEQGASLRLLRWKRFVQGDEELFMANTRHFTELTGVEVRVDSENFEEVRPKAAVAANVGAGPDIIIATNEDHFQYPDRLLDVTDLAEYLGGKYGGWYDAARDFGLHQGRWFALPTGAAGGAMVYRKSMLAEAGFDTFPRDFPGFLKLCQALKARSKPAGFALGHATGDANGWVHWLMWGFGGKLADEHDRVAINSKETIAALEYATELYQTFAPGTLSWLDPSNNKAFLAGEISLTLNGISIYYAAKNSTDPNMREIAADIQHDFLPIGPIGQRATGGLMFPAFIFKYSKYPNAAKEYLRFMMEKEQYVPWQAACIGYVSQTLRAYESNPVWTADPQHVFYRDVVKTMRHDGYAGSLGLASAATMADFVAVDMFAEACSGQQTPSAAARRAEARARRHYRA